MPPSMLSSEALVIWMLRIAMKEPIMAASTAIQTVALARFGSTAVGADRPREGSGTDIADVAGFDMAPPSERGTRYFGYGYGLAVAGLHPSLRFRLGGWGHPHTRTRRAARAGVARHRGLLTDMLSG